MDPRMRRLRTLPLALALALAACGGGGGNTPTSFVPVSTTMSFAGNLPVSVSGGLAAFLADEATTGPTGTDRNGDGDFIDRIAVVVNLSGGETILDVAAESLHWAGSVLYLVVDEAADGRNWETVDTGMNTVLLAWSSALMMPVYVDTLGSDGIAVASTRVFFASATAAPAMAGDTSIRFVNSAVDATATTDVLSVEALALSPRILGSEAGLVFLALDETVEAQDLNGDADMTDGSVLALLDGTTGAGMLRSTGLALQDDGAGWRARSRGAGDWLVAFLVSEAAQGATSLNDPSLFSANWQPTQCVGPDDVDANDQVLHALELAAWFTDPVMDPARNLGLVSTLGLTTGTARIVLFGDYVGIVSAEADDGCDLNMDADQTDLVFRWVLFQADPLPILPVTDATFLRAVRALPGGTRGAAVLGSRFLIADDEAADGRNVFDPINPPVAVDYVLVGWINPAAPGGGFTFAHPGYVEATWMAEQSNGAVLPIGLSERLNVSQGGISNGDGDTLDSFPAYALFNGPQTDLNFPGIAIAIDADDAGTLLTAGVLLYRADEAAQGSDLNGDGDMTDFILMRTSTGTAFTATVDALAPLPGRFAVDTDLANPVGGLYIASESGAARDYNGDGDTTDNVLRYFRF